jgi:hypothetical protein
MATYAFKGRGAAIPYDAPMQNVLKRNISFPDLIANPGKLALAATPSLGLTSFSTGFANGDVLELFEVPAGFLLTNLGVRISTGQAETAAFEIGYNSATQTALGVAATSTDPNAYLASGDLTSAGVQDISLFGKVDRTGTQDNFADLYVTNGSIDMTFGTAIDYDVAIFDIWVIGQKVF